MRTSQVVEIPGSRAEHDVAWVPGGGVSAEPQRPYILVHGDP